MLCIQNKKTFGQILLVLVLFATGCEKNVTRNESTDRHLHLAVEAGDIDLVQSLISSAADINAKDSNSRTPLHSAIALGKNDIAVLLIATGADVNAMDNNGWTSLHLAVIRGNYDVVWLLVFKGANVNKKRNDGETPLSLSLAKDGDHTQIVELLRKQGAKE